MLCRESEWEEVLADALLGAAQAEISEERWGPAEELLGKSLKAAEGEGRGQQKKGAEGGGRPSPKFNPSYVGAKRRRCCLKGCIMQMLMDVFPSPLD